MIKIIAWCVNILKVSIVYQEKKEVFNLVEICNHTVYIREACISQVQGEVIHTRKMSSPVSLSGAEILQK